MEVKEMATNHCIFLVETVQRKLQMGLIKIIYIGALKLMLCKM